MITKLTEQQEAKFPWGKLMTDAEIENQRVAGDITLVLKNGTESERESLLRTIEAVCGRSERERLDRWIAEGMPDA